MWSSSSWCRCLWSELESSMVWSSSNWYRCSWSRISVCLGLPHMFAFLNKHVNVLLPLTQKIEETSPFVFAGFRNTKKSKIFSDAIICARSTKDLAKSGERFDCMFGIIIVPRYPIVIEKCEKLVAVLLKALFALDCDLTFIIALRKFFIVPFNEGPVCS